MSVYIEMEMPKNCTECPLFIRSNSPKYPFVDCKLIGRLGSIFNAVSIPVDCPLIELPPHGDLIDRDALERDIDKYIGGEESRSRFHHWVQVQSVVILGDRGEET